VNARSFSKQQGTSGKVHLMRIQKDTTAFAYQQGLIFGELLGQPGFQSWFFRKGTVGMVNALQDARGCSATSSVGRPQALQTGCPPGYTYIDTRPHWINASASVPFRVQHISLRLTHCQIRLLSTIGLQHLQLEMMSRCRLMKPT